MAWNSSGKVGWLAAVSFPAQGSQGQAIMPGFLKAWVGYGNKLGSSCLHSKNFTSEAISLAPASFQG